MLLNEGNGAFQKEVDLVGGESTTNVISVADVNKDGWVDIIIGNDEGEYNQLLLNNGGDGNFELLEMSQSKDLSTTSISVADVNNDNEIERIVIFFKNGSFKNYQTT